MLHSPDIRCRNEVAVQHVQIVLNTPDGNALLSGKLRVRNIHIEFKINSGSVGHSLDDGGWSRRRLWGLRHKEQAHKESHKFHPLHVP